MATGASSLSDVKYAVDTILENNKNLILMQCNTNYTGSNENFKYINLNVLKLYSILYPNMLLGLSDHTPGHSTVLGSIALGARVIEKHFTSNNALEGPDHSFSMNPKSWKEMINRSRELELALGESYKKIEENEKETVILQRRCLRLKHDVNEGEILHESDIEILRPAPLGAFLPYQLGYVIGKKILKDMKKGQAIYEKDISSLIDEEE